MNNPIMMREIHRYQTLTPRWLQKAETVGLALVGLMIGAALVLDWFIPRLTAPPTQAFLTTAIDLQVILNSLYFLVLIRCLIAGVSTANRYRRESYDDVMLTGISRRTLILGMWRGALHQVGGWLLLLGIVRFAVILVMLMDASFLEYRNAFSVIANGGYIYRIHPLQLPTAFIWAIVLSLLDVWATVGVGIVAGMWLRNSVLAWMAAVVLRALPIVIFTFYPETPPYALGWLYARWYEFTWFAFVDGGTTALLRLSMRFVIQGDELVRLTTPPILRAFLAFLAAVHMLVLYGLFAYAGTWLHLWRQFGGGVARVRLTLPMWKNGAHSYRNLAIIAGACVVCVGMAWVWRDYQALMWSARYSITPNSFPYNPPLMNALYIMTNIIIAGTTIALLMAGIRHAQRHPVGEILPAAIALSHGLRGWMFGLSLVLMTLFSLLILEYRLPIHASHTLRCLASERSSCEWQYPVWHILQWVLAFGAIIAISGALVVSSAVVGIVIGSHIRRFTLAASVAIMVRVLPLALHVVPLATFLGRTGFTANYAVSSLEQNVPSASIADIGVAALVKLAQPQGYWFNDSLWAVSQNFYTVVMLALVLYLLVGYAAASLALHRVLSRLSLVKRQTPLASSSRHTVT